MVRHVLRNALIPILTHVVVADPVPVHRRAAARVVLRHPRPRRDDGRRDQRQRLRHAARDGLHRRAALHRRADRHRRRATRSPIRACGSSRAARWSRTSSSNCAVALLARRAARRRARALRRSALWRERRRASSCGAARSRWRASALYVARRRCSTRSRGSAAPSGAGASRAQPRSLIDRALPGRLPGGAATRRRSPTSSSTAARRCAIRARTGSAPTSSAATCCSRRSRARASRC